MVRQRIETFLSGKLRDKVDVPVVSFGKFTNNSFLFNGYSFFFSAPA